MTDQPAVAGAGGPSVGLPEGVRLAPVSRRVAAFLMDAFVPYLLTIAAVIVLAAGAPGWAAVLLLVLPVAWLVLQWWLTATRAAGVGMRLLRLQVVGLQDGRPLGWTRALVRGLVLVLLGGSLLLLAVMAVLMLRQLRRQGWHDLAVGSVVIEERLPADRPTDGFAEIDADARSRMPTAAAAATAVTGEHSSAEPTLDPTASPVGPLPGPVPGGSPVLQPVATGREPETVPPAASPDRRGTVPAPGTGPDAVDPAPAPPNQGWYVVIDDDREIAITRLILFGRNPEPRAGEEDAVVIKVVDEARTVSKTHLGLTVDSRGVLVTDRGSTNGSAVTDPYGIYTLLTPHEPMRLPTEGYLVSFGRHQLRIVRH